MYWPEEDCVSVVAFSCISEPCPPAVGKPCRVGVGKKWYLGVTAKTGTFLPYYYSPKKRAAYLADVLTFSAHV